MFAFDRKRHLSTTHSPVPKPMSQREGNEPAVNPLSFWPVTASHARALGPQEISEERRHYFEPRLPTSSSRVSPNPQLELAQIPTTTPPLQRKSAISAPGDPYEHEADEVADKVLRMAEPVPVGPAPVAIQRKCGQCEDEGRKPIQTKRAASASTDVALDAEAAVRAVSHGGEPLSQATRSFFEPRFGYDFSSVRIHTDGKAAAAARSVRARAYTLGHHIAFAQGEYAPSTARGRLLLAHELAHTLQQGAAQPAERAGVASAAAVRRTPAHTALRLSRAPDHTLQRWKIANNIATAENPVTDTLGNLAVKVGGTPEDWKCIRPISMRAASLAPLPKNFEDHYELYVQPGDTFDVSNLQLQALGKGPHLYLMLFGPAGGYVEAGAAAMVAKFYPGTTSASGPIEDAIARASGEGATPIEVFLLAGHQAGGEMYGAAGRFDPSQLRQDSPSPTFVRALAGKLPRRCWFARSATVRSLGCNSRSFADAFAKVFLRKGSTISYTLRFIGPSCTTRYRAKPPATGCESEDALSFAPSLGEPFSPDHGPFVTAAELEASLFWDFILGAL